ncbi:hypothetical protein N9G77_004415 [Escherichia coli]|uniref:hypothetical protein n=1 Tax=Escherichia coli TaxID=562 RepID=UPI003986FD0E|nr:hypothetical protein [Escherichia coli]EJX1083248.1 hypothetical protein [Escherichia coli]
MSIIRFTEYTGSGGAGAVMVLAERITHFYRQYGTHDGTVIELDTGKTCSFLKIPTKLNA